MLQKSLLCLGVITPLSLGLELKSSSLKEDEGEGKCNVKLPSNQFCKIEFPRDKPRYFYKHPTSFEECKSMCENTPDGKCSEFGWVSNNKNEVGFCMNLLFGAGNYCQEFRNEADYQNREWHRYKCGYTSPAEIKMKRADKEKSEAKVKEVVAKTESTNAKSEKVEAQEEAVKAEEDETNASDKSKAREAHLRAELAKAKADAAGFTEAKEDAVAEQEKIKGEIADCTKKGGERLKAVEKIIQEKDTKLQESEGIFETLSEQLGDVLDIQKKLAQEARDKAILKQKEEDAAKAAEEAAAAKAKAKAEQDAAKKAEEERVAEEKKRVAAEKKKEAARAAAKVKYDQGAIAAARAQKDKSDCEETAQKKISAANSDMKKAEAKYQSEGGSDIKAEESSAVDKDEEVLVRSKPAAKTKKTQRAFMI